MSVSSAPATDLDRDSYLKEIPDVDADAAKSAVSVLVPGTGGGDGNPEPPPVPERFGVICHPSSQRAVLSETLRIELRRSEQPIRHRFATDSRDEQTI